MKALLHPFVFFACVFILLPARGATISLFSGKAISSQTRGWNGPKDVSATVTISFENDSLVLKAVVNDDRTAQNREDLEIGDGDHLELWLSFTKGSKLHLGFSPGKPGDAKPTGVLWSGGNRPQILESTPPVVTWNGSSYELDAVIPLADLRLDPDDKLQSWAAAVADRDLEPSEKVNILRDMAKELRFFIGRCHENELKIFAAERLGSEELETRVAHLIRYQEQVKPRERFDGVLFDLTEFKPENIEARLAQASQDWHRQFRKAQVWIALPVPESGQVDVNLLEPADEVIFRTKLSGKPEADLESMLKPSLRFAQKYGRPFWISMDTHSGYERDGLLDRVRPLDNAWLERALGVFSTKIAGVEMFRGFALDDYQTYRRLEDIAAPKSIASVPKPRALWVHCGRGLGEAVMTNDYFQRDFFRFCRSPFGVSQNKITHILFEAGEFTRGPKGAEIVLRHPAGFLAEDPQTWTPFK